MDLNELFSQIPAGDRLGAPAQVPDQAITKAKAVQQNGFAMIQLSTSEHKPGRVAYSVADTPAVRDALRNGGVEVLK